MVSDIKKDTARKLAGAAEQSRTASPIHPAFLASEIVDFLDKDATIIFDALVGSSFLTERIESKAAGHVLDTGEWITIGHGIGMGIGAQLARPGKQVFVMMGDGGIGAGGLLSLYAWRSYGAGYGIYAFLTLFLPTTSGSQSMIRYLLVCFPIFLVLGEWGRNEKLDRGIVLVFSALLGLLTAVFVSWIFVA